MRRLLLCLVMVLAGCGNQVATPTRSESADQAQVAASPSVGPTNTPRPTATPLPTQTVALEITTSPDEVDTAELTVGSAAPTPNAAALSETLELSEPVRLVIAGVKIDAQPIAVGLDENNVPIVPKHDVGWYNLSASPGEGENVVFWGHVLRWLDAPDIPAPFAQLQDATEGMTITVHSADGSQHDYVITQRVWATPDQVQYILPTGKEQITLVSCIGDKVIVNGNLEMTHRLVTIAEPVSANP